MNSHQRFSQGQIIRGVVGEWEVRAPQRDGDESMWLVASAGYWSKFNPEHEDSPLVVRQARYGLLAELPQSEIDARSRVGVYLGAMLLDRAHDWTWVIQVDNSTMRKPRLSTETRSLLQLAALTAQSGVPLNYLTGRYDTYDAPNPWVDVAPTGRLLAPPGQLSARKRIGVLIDPISGRRRTVLDVDDSSLSDDIATGPEPPVRGCGKPVALDLTGHRHGCRAVVDALAAALSPPFFVTDLIAAVELVVDPSEEGARVSGHWADAGFSVCLASSPSALRRSVGKCRCRKGRDLVSHPLVELVSQIHDLELPELDTEMPESDRTWSLVLAADALQSLRAQGESATSTGDVIAGAILMEGVPTVHLHHADPTLDRPGQLREARWLAGLTVVAAGLIIDANSEYPDRFTDLEVDTVVRRRLIEKATEYLIDNILPMRNRNARRVSSGDASDWLKSNPYVSRPLDMAAIAVPRGQALDSMREAAGSVGAFMATNVLSELPVLPSLEGPASYHLVRSDGAWRWERRREPLSDQ